MILRKGMSGPDVLNLEQVLNALGFMGFTVDGEFDQGTENVVKYLQTQGKLKSDGIVGPKTLDYLDGLYQPFVANFAQKPTITVTPDPITGVFPKGDEELTSVHPVLACKTLQIINLASQEGYNVTTVQGLRSFPEQHALFLKRPRVTKADAGQSYHNYGVADDLAFVVNGQVSWDDRLYKNLGRWASRVGLEWGGNWHFVDKPHVQLANMPAIAKLRPLYDAGGVKNVWLKLFVS